MCKDILTGGLKCQAGANAYGYARGFPRRRHWLSYASDRYVALRLLYGAPLGNKDCSSHPGSRNGGKLFRGEDRKDHEFEFERRLHHGLRQALGSLLMRAGAV